MRQPIKVHQVSALALLLVLGFSTFTNAGPDKKKVKLAPTGPAVLWREPTDISSRDLYLGPGGEQMKPDLSKVTLIKEEKGGYSTKYRVRDGSGHEWIAKIGKEAQPETAAVRLMWGVGFFADVDYLVPSVRIEGLSKTLENVRFGARPKDVARIDVWKWNNNPFVGTREFQGLKVMMALLNNWDIKDSNNKILGLRNENGENELRYIVHDLGATFGKSGGAFWTITRSRNDVHDYVKASFIDKVKDGHVDFHYSGKRNDLFADITIEDAKWMGDWLARLSNQQIEDAFRAANYSPEEVQLLSAALRQRIRELVELPALTATRELNQ